MQMKENKITSLVSKKYEEEKSRKEPQTIFQKTVRLKQRIDDRRKACVKENQHDAIPTPEKNTHQTWRDESSKTPQKQRDLHPFRKIQPQNMTEKSESVSKSPNAIKKIVDTSSTRNLHEKAFNSKYMIICNDKFRVP